MTGPGGRRDARWIFLSDLDRTSTRPRGTPTRFGWRLVAANNRPLGRGVALSESLTRCVDDALVVHRAAQEDALHTSVAPQHGGSAWSWRAQYRGVAIAVSTHAFVRRVECARAMSQFVAAAARCEPHPDLVRHYGAQALRGYDEAGDAPDGRG